MCPCCYLLLNIDTLLVSALLDLHLDMNIYLKIFFSSFFLNSIGMTKCVHIKNKVISNLVEVLENHYPLEEFGINAYDVDR